MAALTDSGDLFRWVEGQGIKLSFAHDPLFAVSMSGARGFAASDRGGVLAHAASATAAVCARR
jgi:hypothetical protein